MLCRGELGLCPTGPPGDNWLLYTLGRICCLPGLPEALEEPVQMSNVDFPRWAKDYCVAYIGQNTVGHICQYSVY